MLKKDIVVYLSRAIGVHIPGRADPEQLTKGRNLVDAEVAEHPFVKDHFMDGAQAEALAGADAALIAANKELIARAEAAEENLRVGSNAAHAKFNELTAQVDELTARAEAAEAKVAEQKTLLDAFNATGAPTAGKAK